MDSDFYPGEMFWSVLATILLLLQLPASAILLSRLLKGPTRRPPLQPTAPLPTSIGTVSILVPTLNEAQRIAPCLTGLSRQTHEVREILVVDSRSQDGTPDLVKKAEKFDPRFRLITDDPLPPGWVGRPWALHTGFLHTSEQSQWVLGIDADTHPLPGLVSSLIATAESEGYDLLTLAPRFILKYPNECWLQPALLMTLVYRFGPAGDLSNPSERVMANGQCFFCRRSMLAQVGGYSSARSSFCDDVTLARNIALVGGKVGFLDGSNLIHVRMYEGALETWREWGRSLDLKDATPKAQVWSDLWFLAAVQGLPILLLLTLGGVLLQGVTEPTVFFAFYLNLTLVIIRVALTLAIMSSYDLSQVNQRWLFWLSPLADPLAFIRILLSSIQTPRSWRGRSYDSVKGE